MPHISVTSQCSLQFTGTCSRIQWHHEFVRFGFVPKFFRTCRSGAYDASSAPPLVSVDLARAAERRSIEADIPSREDLVRMYGSSNVADQDADFGDGVMQSGTSLVSISLYGCQLRHYHLYRAIH